MNEAEAISEFLTKQMNIKFELTKPAYKYPPAERLEWVVRYLDEADVKKSPYFNMIWAEKGGTIHLESVELGSSYTWVEDAYGERGVIALSKLNLTGFAERTDIRKMFGKRFPKVRKRLEMSEKMIAGVSAKIDIPMSMVYEEVRGKIVEFRIGAIVDGIGLDFDSKKSRIETTINALKEAYDNICKYEAKIL